MTMQIGYHSAGTVEARTRFLLGEVHAIKEQIYGDLKAEITVQIVA